jgi:uncharacterized membrane protein
MKINMMSGDNLVYILALLSIGAIVFIYFTYKVDANNALVIKGWKKFALWSFRVIIALMIFFALGKPSVTLTEEKRYDPIMAFVIDQSASMTFPDAPENSVVKNLPKPDRTRFNAAKTVVNQLYPDLHKTHDIKVYGFSDTINLISASNKSKKDGEAQPEVFAEKVKSDGEYSNVGDGLQDTLRELSANQISGIVFMSDGRETGGEPIKKVIERAAKAGVPIHTVTFGTEFPLRDLAIDEVLAPAEASLGDALTFTVKITNQISSNLQTSLSVYEEGELVAEKKLDLKRGMTEVLITVVPEVEGTRKFELKLPVQPDEVNIKNNENITHVIVIKRTLRVLLIAGNPSLEYYYLVPALLRDPIVDVSCYLQSADVDYTHQGNRGIKEIPKTQKEWEEYDVVVLMDVDPSGITPPQVNGLEALVNKGGGLLVVSGLTNGVAKFIQIHGAKIRSMLPVDIDQNYLPNLDDIYSTPFKMNRTNLGKGHPIMMASGNEAVNKEVWSTFPSFFWSQPVKGTKPGAITLLEREGGGKEATVMAIHRYGEGAVFFTGIGDFWRWRFPYENFDYDRFWVRAIRYLGETKLLGSQKQAVLSTDRKVYNPGEKVQLSLRLLDPALLMQLQGQQLFVKVETPEKEVTMVALKADSTGEPIFRGEYLAKGAGSMLAECRQAAPGGDSQAKPLFEVKTSFKVERISLEDKDTSADIETMKLLAEKTGGKAFDYNNMTTVGSLAKLIPSAEQIITRDKSTEVWDSLPFLLIFIVFICVEWSLRKWWGLL